MGEQGSGQEGAKKREAPVSASTSTCHQDLIRRMVVPIEGQQRVAGFDHGAGHPLLFLDDAKVPNCQKNNGFNDLGNYSEWPKVAGAVIKAK